MEFVDNKVEQVAVVRGQQLARLFKDTALTLLISMMLSML